MVFEAEVGAVGAVVVEIVVVEAVPSTSTVKLAERTFSPSSSFFSLPHPHTSDSDKKFHQGWGGDDGNTEFKSEQAAAADAVVESVANDWNAAPAPETADWAGTGADTSADPDPWGAPPAATDSWDAPAQPVAPAADNDKPEGRPRRDRDAEEEDNTLTLSQYLAQQKEKDPAIPKLENTRKANEGAGDDLWKDTVPLQKNEEEEAYFLGKVCLFLFFNCPFFLI